MGSHPSKLHLHRKEGAPPLATAPPNPFTTVIPTTVRESTPDEDDNDIIKLRRECPRFRILVIGRANAGKTTILQKMCNTKEAPIIHDRHGNEVDPSTIVPTQGRGIHDINNELTFSSNTSFIFHDSCGFEAGSTKELDDIRKFIAERAVSNELRDQLHAIWYCLPTDDARPLQEAEMSFFKHGTGKVPVIAIFTKYDGMILKEFNKLRFGMELDWNEAKHLAPKQADQLFRESEYYVKRLQASKFPPARYLRIQDMHKPESDCAELSQETSAALNSKKLCMLFVSVQQNNIGLATNFAIKEFMLDGK